METYQKESQSMKYKIGAIIIGIAISVLLLTKNTAVAQTPEPVKAVSESKISQQVIIDKENCTFYRTDAKVEVYCHKVK